jgi:hypothetical protein
MNESTPRQEPRRDTLAAQAARLVAALQSENQSPKPKPGPRPNNGGTRVRLLTATLAGILVLGAVWMIATGRWLRSPGKIPPELIGTWSTTEPSHADRPFRITDSTLVLHRGGSDSLVSAITDVRSRRAADGVEYTIQYSVEGESYLFSFTLMGGPDRAIQFRNQPRLVWHKQP